MYNAFILHYYHSRFINTRICEEEMYTHTYVHIYTNLLHFSAFEHWIAYVGGQ